MFGTILRFIKFNNFGTWRLNRSRPLCLSFCCTTWRIYEPLRVFEPSFNADNYGMYNDTQSLCYHCRMCSMLFVCGHVLMTMHECNPDWYYFILGQDIIGSGTLPLQILCSSVQSCISPTQYKRNNSTRPAECMCMSVSL